MQHWCGLVLLFAATFVAAQTDKKNGTATRFGPGVGGPPFGQGGFGPVGAAPGGFVPGGVGHGFPQGVSPPIGPGGFVPGGVGPGFPQGVSPPIGPGPFPPVGIVGPGGNPQQPLVSPQRPDCKFYKKDAFGRWVCDVDQKVYECPPLRPECPRISIPGAIPPQQCFNDNDCYLNDKCCPDICFDHLICKGPE